MAKRIPEEIRLRIKGYLEGFIDGLLKGFQVGSLDPKELRPIRKHDSDGALKPFHEAILPHGILLASEFDRSFSTSLGSSFEEAAYQIALNRFPIVERQKRLEGEIANNAIRLVDRLKADIASNKTHFSSALSQVLQCDSKTKTSIRIITDFYIETKNKEEYHFELKTPKPNKDQCFAFNERALKIQRLRKKRGKKIYTYFTFPYNPYGFNREQYKHSITLNYCDFGQSILIGSEFWDFIGGIGTYLELLKIYREVGKERGPEIVEKIMS